MQKISRSINDFLRWWGRELAFLVPNKLKHVFNDNPGQLIILPEEGWVNLELNIDGKPQKLARLQLNELGGIEFKKLCAADERIKKMDAILRLSKADAVKKYLFLPKAANENLQQVVTYELDKNTPFNPDQVYFSLKQIALDDESDLMKILLVIAPKVNLDTVCKELREWGLAPLLAEYAGAPNDFANDHEYYNLLPDWAKLKKSALSRFLNPAILLVLLLLLCFVLILPVWIELQTNNVLREQVSAVSKEASKVEALSSETDLLLDESKLLIATKKKAASMIRMLDTLSKVIADDTWLTHFQFSNSKLQIQGQSPNASSLIGVLEQSPLFSSVRFVSPVTQDKRTGLERFQVTAQVNNIEGQGNAE